MKFILFVTTIIMLLIGSFAEISNGFIKSLILLIGLILVASLFVLWHKKK